MGRKRQTFSKEFKAKVVLETLREESTIQEIAVKHGVHQNQISQWKAQAIAGMTKLFERPNKKSEEVRQQDEKDFNLLVKIKEVQIEHPYYGYRRIWREINKNGGDTTETTVRRVMRRFGITAVFPGKNLSKACKYHKKYPYLLRNKVIRYPNQVWSTDITYIKLPTGNVYLMAIIDRFSRKVLSWRMFNTMDALQYANLLRETIEEYGCPAIFNTDQGSQFTSDVFIKFLVDYPRG